MNEQDHSFIPAARLHSLTRLYDPFTRLLFGQTFVRIAHTLSLSDGLRVLDVGCGPAGLTMELWKVKPAAMYTALDVDPEILDIAQAKAKKYNANISFIQSSATSLPFDDESFDIVVSSLSFHHLTMLQKKEAISEIYRVLSTGGIFWLFDFAEPKNILGKVLVPIYRHLEEIEEHVHGRVHEEIKKHDFSEPQYHWNRFGMISLYSAQKSTG